MPALDSSTESSQRRRSRRTADLATLALDASSVSRSTSRSSSLASREPMPPLPAGRDAAEAEVDAAPAHSGARSNGAARRPRSSLASSSSTTTPASASSFGPSRSRARRLLPSLPFVLLLGVLARLLLFAYLPTSTLDLLSKRVELVSPSTSFSSLSEGIYLLRAYEQQQALLSSLAAQHTQRANATTFDRLKPRERRELEQSIARDEEKKGRLIVPNPWASGQVHHAPLLVHSLRYFIPTPAVELHRDYAAASAHAIKVAEQRRERERQLRSRTRAPEKGSASAPIFAFLSSLLARLLSLQPYHYLWVTLDLLAALMLGLTERQRSRWRSKYARIRGLRELQMEVEARRLAEQQQQQAPDSSVLSSHAVAKAGGEQEEDRSAKVALLYLLNPLTLLTTLALSTTTLFNFLALLALFLVNSLSNLTRSSRRTRKAAAAGIGGDRSGAPEDGLAVTLLGSFALPLVLAFHLVASPLSLLVLPPLVLLARRFAPSSTTSTAGELAAVEDQLHSPQKVTRQHATSSSALEAPRTSLATSITSFTLLFSLVLFLLNIGPLASYDLAGVLHLQYAHQFLLTDLAPNIGLWWYFFIEMFDHFRSFFLLAFNVHLASYTIPLSIKFR